MTHIGHRTHAIVCRAIDNERCAADTVAFVANVFVGDSFELTRALENSVLNRVLRDIAAARLDKRETQTGIRVRAATMISRTSFVQRLERLASWRPLRC